MVTLKENKHTSDLEGGTLYAIVLEKIPQSLLSQYYRWVKEKGKLESLEELREWVAEEAEYQVEASERKNGVSSAGGRQVKWPRSYFGTGDKNDRPCKVCNQKHPIWKCEVLKGMENKKKWETAKKLGLAEGHFVCACAGQITSIGVTAVMSLFACTCPISCLFLFLFLIAGIKLHEDGRFCA